MKNNQSEVKTMLKEAGILFLITCMAGLLLGLVFEVTKEPRKEQKEKAIQEACIAAFPDTDGTGVSFQQLTEYDVSEELAQKMADNGVFLGSVYEAVNSQGEKKGYVVESTSTEGYAGNIVIYTGVALDGTIQKVDILEISETPGLGMLAGKVLIPQFSGKQVSQFTYTKVGSTSESEIDAISGATFTTSAVVNAVNAAIDFVTLEVGGAQNE